jgi:hypothetical protein
VVRWAANAAPKLEAACGAGMSCCHFAWMRACMQDARPPPPGIPSSILMQHRLSLCISLCRLFEQLKSWDKPSSPPEASGAHQESEQQRAGIDKGRQAASGPGVGEEAAAGKPSPPTEMPSAHQPSDVSASRAEPKKLVAMGGGGAPMRQAVDPAGDSYQRGRRVSTVMCPLSPHPSIPTRADAKKGQPSRTCCAVPSSLRCRVGHTSGPGTTTTVPANDPGRGRRAAGTAGITGTAAAGAVVAAELAAAAVAGAGGGMGGGQLRGGVSWRTR